MDMHWAGLMGRFFSVLFESVLVFCGRMLSELTWWLTEIAFLSDSRGVEEDWIHLTVFTENTFSNLSVLCSSNTFIGYKASYNLPLEKKVSFWNDFHGSALLSAKKDIWGS